MNTLLENQAETMLALQASMNSKVDEQWLSARYPYLRAVVIEGAEAIEHHGWKWWKHQQHDLSQLQMELIDIWHFMLSEMILDSDGDLGVAGKRLMADANAPAMRSLTFDGQVFQLEKLDLVGKLELLIGTSVARRVEVKLFESIMADCHLNWEQLFQQYVGKNVLNFFRQDHGYKEGSYRKEWNGREDNEHLVEILAELDAQDQQFQEHLYRAMEERYQASN